MRWDLTYLGSQVVAVVSSPEAYGILDEHELTSWQSGGCWILASALSSVLNGEMYALVRPDGVVDHVVVKHDGAYFDADGAFTARGVVEKHEYLEGRAVRLRRFRGEDSGMVCPPVAVRSLMELFGDRLGVHDYAATGVMPNDVVELPDPPPRVTIGSRFYALSDIGVPIVAGDPSTDPGFGARVTEGGGNPWRYIWVHEPDSDQLEMYRYSDGEWKVLGGVRDYPQTVERLRRARQLNVVSRSEADEFEAEMRRRNEETIVAMQKSWESMKSGEQHKVEGLVRRYWDDDVQPMVNQLWAAIDAGVDPIGFEYDADFAERTGKSREAQAKVYALSFAIRRAGFAPFDSPLEKYVVSRLGLPSSEELEDIQAIHWAHGDVLDDVYRRAAPRL